MAAKILLLDIEVSPIEAYVWSLRTKYIAPCQIKRDIQIISFAAKWLDVDETMWYSIEDDDWDETNILSALHELMDKADIIVAHNGDRFDVTMINGKFFEHRMPPPAPFKTVDTLKVARSNFRLSSNKLDYMAKKVGFKGKLENQGMQLWIDCLNGKKSAWKEMVDYNIQDVAVLEDIYVEIRPWITNHPNVAVYSNETRPCCSKCGGTKIHFRGFATTTAGKYHRFQCQDCFGWGRTGINILSKEKRKGLMRNVSK